MKLISFLTMIFALVLTTYAGPTTNNVEYKADALLTKAQQADYTKKLEQGIAYFDAAKYDQAEAEFKSILAFAPKKALAFFNLGLTKYKQGDYQAAINNFDAVIKMRSYYVGAAFYYKSISQLNLEQNEAAIKTSKRFTQARFFYNPAQSLTKTIATGSDEYFENAKLAIADENYELCLLEMEESVLTDTKSGKALVAECTASLNKEPTAAVVANESSNGHYYNLFLDTHISQTDNIYQETTGAIKKLTYFTEFGGELLIRNFVDTGIGASYSQFGAIDLARFKDENYDVHVPFYFRSNKNRIAANIFYNLSKYIGDNSYDDVGLNMNYSFSETDYTLGMYGSTLSRNSLNTNFNYKAGTYNFYRLYASRNIDNISLGANVSYEQIITGDQPYGATVIPYANKTMSYGLNAGYDFNKISKLSLSTSLSTKNYTNKLSANNIYRADKTTNITLSYQHTLNKFLSANLQQSMITNKSNYDATELVNRNYNENVTTLGISLHTN